MSRATNEVLNRPVKGRLYRVLRDLATDAPWGFPEEFKLFRGALVLVYKSKMLWRPGGVYFVEIGLLQTRSGEEKSTHHNIAEIGGSTWEHHFKPLPE